MKYLKCFEKYIPNPYIPKNPNKDYDQEMIYTENELVFLKKHGNRIAEILCAADEAGELDGFDYELWWIDTEEVEDVFSIDQDEILRRVEPHEIEALKYNL